MDLPLIMSVLIPPNENLNTISATSSSFSCHFVRITTSKPNMLSSPTIFKPFFSLLRLLFCHKSLTLISAPSTLPALSSSPSFVFCWGFYFFGWSIWGIKTHQPSVPLLLATLLSNWSSRINTNFVLRLLTFIPLLSRTYEQAFFPPAPYSYYRSPHLQAL